jgi:3-phenylpropionate/trans-cinnamate dioxygenase ferredoxin subunit
MTDFVAVAALDDVKDKSALAVVVDDVEIALVRCGDEVFAIRDECSHASVALSEGDVGDCEVECWLHGSRFDLRTGEPIGLPATVPVPVYATKIDGDQILVDVHQPLNSETIAQEPISQQHRA